MCRFCHSEPSPLVSLLLSHSLSPIVWLADFLLLGKASRVGLLIPSILPQSLFSFVSLALLDMLYHIWYNMGMNDSLKILPARFFRTASGTEPVREWLKGLDKEDSRIIGGDMILLHGFIKKTQQTPHQDLELADRRRREYESHA